MEIRNIIYIFVTYKILFIMINLKDIKIGDNIILTKTRTHKTCEQIVHISPTRIVTESYSKSRCDKYITIYPELISEDFDLVCDEDVNDFSACYKAFEKRDKTNDLIIKIQNQTKTIIAITSIS